VGKTSNAVHRHWAACYLLPMEPSNPLLVPTFITSLTNAQRGVRISACDCLAEMGPAAQAAVPALRRSATPYEPDPEVRTRAGFALAKIAPGG
jgi:hypothetical protein